MINCRPVGLDVNVMGTVVVMVEVEKFAVYVVLDEGTVTLWLMAPPSLQFEKLYCVVPLV
jgi:hypothetical protein